MSAPAKISDEAIAQWLSEPASRRVPPEIKEAALRQTAPLSTVAFGLLFAAFGSLFMAFMFPWRIDRDVRLKLGAVSSATGQVLEASPTSLKIGRARVYRYRFELHTATGEHIESECFTTGQRFRVRQPVPVRYQTDNPALACVEGARLTRSTPAMMFIALFPTVGLVIAVATLVRRRRTRWLLENGQLTEATIVGLEATQTRVADNPVYRIRLRLEGVDEVVTVRRYTPKVVALAQQRGIGGMLFVLFDPKKPKRVLLPESLID